MVELIVVLGICTLLSAIYDVLKKRHFTLRTTLIAILGAIAIVAYLATLIKQGGYAKSKNNLDVKHPKISRSDFTKT